MMRDEGAVAGIPSPTRFYDPKAPLDKALPETIAEHGLKREPQPATAASATDRSRGVAGSLVPGVVAALGLAPDVMASARRRAALHGTDVARELVAAGEASEQAIAAAMAKALRLPVEPILPQDRIVGLERRAMPSAGGGGTPPRLLKTCDGRLRTKLFLAPRLEALDAAERFLAAHPDQRQVARVATPRAIARQLAGASEAGRDEAARFSLARDRPNLSARHVLTGVQGMAAAAGLIALLLLAVLLPEAFFPALHLVSIPFFLGCVVLRLCAALRLGRQGTGSPPGAPPASRQADTARPVYSVLVALHRESEVVHDLVAALGRLDWPRSRLEVFLVCEGDDPATLSAARNAIAGRPGFEIAVVPPSQPRTKPKALNFALPLATGAFVVIYDAEDRPCPDQLQAAFRRFEESGPDLACLQAPLVVRNGGANWLAGHFALEYAALFRGLLPYLSERGLPLPLGGTSNHFRREALLAAGGWDSHNVTEDADLGIRLCRGGYRIATIDAPTFEDAPERWQDWRNQRTRWMKGWMQTWLVHMRHPARLARDLGPGGFLAFQLLLLGMVASTLAHPFFFGFLAYTVWSTATAGLPDTTTRILAAADLVNLALGYLAYALLVVRSLDGSETPALRHRLWTLTGYWFLISLASLRAFVQLMRDPHKWEKTPHGPSARAKTTAA